jgi:hypothetical protein
MVLWMLWDGRRAGRFVYGVGDEVMMVCEREVAYDVANRQTI